MQSGKFFGKINLQTAINDESDTQKTTVEAEGELYQTSRQTVIRFTEKIEDQPEVKVMITVKPDQVTIKRSGGVAMNQKFKPEQKTETIYRHQFGSLRMETFTNYFHYQPLTSTTNACLKIDYTTKLNGESERQHKLELSIEEDKS